jgi:hypothetical protein
MVCEKIVVLNALAVTIMARVLDCPFGLEDELLDDLDGMCEAYVSHAGDDAFHNDLSMYIVSSGSYGMA